MAFSKHGTNFNTTIALPSVAPITVPYSCCANVARVRVSVRVRVSEDGGSKS